MALMVSKDREHQTLMCPYSGNTKPTDPNPSPQHSIFNPESISGSGRAVFTGRGTTNTTPSPTLFVTNIPPYVRIDQVRQLFANDLGFGQLRTARHMVFVDFDSVSRASAAMRAHQGHVFAAPPHSDKSSKDNSVAVTSDTYAYTDAQALSLATRQGLSSSSDSSSSGSGKDSGASRYARGLMIDYDKDIRSKRDGLYERQRLREYTSNNEDAHLLVTIICTACHHIALKLRLTPPVTYETLPKRRTDKSLVIDCPKYATHVAFGRGDAVTLKRDGGVEKQWRLTCMSCSIPIAYASVPHESQVKLVYLLDGATIRATKEMLAVQRAKDRAKDDQKLAEERKRLEDEAIATAEARKRASFPVTAQSSSSSSSSSTPTNDTATTANSSTRSSGTSGTGTKRGSSALDDAIAAAMATPEPRAATTPTTASTTTDRDDGEPNNDSSKRARLDTNSSSEKPA